MWKVRKRKPQLRHNAAGLSDEATRELLQEALFQVEGGEDVDWLYVNAFFPDDSTVIYTVRRQESLSEMWQREFTLDVNKETVELSADRRKATRRVTYEVNGRKLSNLTLTFSPDTTRDNLITQTARQVARILGITSLQGDSMSDVDLREALWKSLQSTVVGFVGIEEVMPNESLVVYSTYIEETGSYSLYWRTFDSADNDGVVSVTLNDDEIQVQPVTRYEPVQSTNKQSSPCGCQQKGSANMNEKVRKLADALIASGAFVENERATLETFTEDRLSKLSATLVKSDTPTEPATETPVPSTPPAPEAIPAANKEVSESQLAELVEKRVLASIEKKNAEAERLKLVELMTANAIAKENLGDELKDMTLESLQKVAKALKIDTNPPVDYSPRGANVRNNSDDQPPPAPDLNAAIRAHRGVETKAA